MEKSKRIGSFRDLIAWQRAMDLARAVYKLTASMPESERFGLVNQMRRAAVSIPSNIAEGYGRESLADYLKFLRIARGSNAELSTQIELAESLGMLKSPQIAQSLEEEVGRVLQGLIKSLNRS